MKVEVLDPKDLQGSQVDELYALFHTAFQASREGFEKDLREKEKLLLLSDETGLQAFSTLRSFHPQSDVRVIFSGDTFASPQARSGHRLPALWAEYVFRQMPRQEGVEDFWLLLCSGYRTFRILPTFFQSFVPGGQDETLLLRRDHWAAELFGPRYCSGIVKPRWATPLYQPEPPARLLKDPHVQLFFRANPGYEEGDELVCLVPLCHSNLTPAGRRLALGEKALARTRS